jgi:hypothetical protein
MVVNKQHAIHQAAVIYGIAFLVAIILSLPTGSWDHLLVVPVLFGSIICYLQGIFSPSLWQRSNHVSAQRGSIH